MREPLAKITRTLTQDYVGTGRYGLDAPSACLLPEGEQMQSELSLAAGLEMAAV